MSVPSKAITRRMPPASAQILKRRPFSYLQHAHRGSHGTHRYIVCEMTLHPSGSRFVSSRPSARKPLTICQNDISSDAQGKLVTTSAIES